MLIITGTVGANGKYLVSGIPVQTTSNAVLKIVFENNTSGTNLMLSAGSMGDFDQNAVGMMLASSGGPGNQFLTIVDAAKLAGKVLYVRRAVGIVPAKFKITIE